LQANRKKKNANQRAVSKEMTVVEEAKIVALRAAKEPKEESQGSNLKFAVRLRSL